MGPQSGRGAGRAPIREVKARHEARLLAVEGVLGVGIGESGGEPAIVVFVAGLSEAIRRALPPQLEGYPLRTVVSGAFRAQGDADPGDPAGPTG